MKRILVTSCLMTSLVFSCTHPSSEMKKENESDKDTATIFKSGYATLGVLNMYYEIHGEGKPLVLIHGGGSTIYTSFGRIIPELSKRRQIIAVELQAHGHTEDVDRPETFEQDADDVAELLKYLNIRKADILGFSNGGNTAMRIATRHPEQVNKLIIASSFYKRAGLPKGFFEGMEKATIKDMPQVYKDEFLKIKNDTAKLQRMFDRDRTRMATFKDWTEQDLTSIKAPSFIINGDKDVASNEHAVEMSRLIPNCQLAILPGGHGDYMGEIMSLKAGSKTAPFTIQLIEEFLNK